MAGSCTIGSGLLPLNTLLYNLLDFVCVCVSLYSEAKPPDVLLLADSRQQALGPSTLTPPPHQPSVIRRWAELISSTVNLRRRFITRRHCGARQPPARAAAFQFHIRPITQLGLLKTVPPCKIALEV